VKRSNAEEDSGEVKEARRRVIMKFRNDPDAPRDVIIFK
jgi:hypothetical protein